MASRFATAVRNTNAQKRIVAAATYLAQRFGLVSVIEPTPPAGKLDTRRLNEAIATQREQVAGLLEELMASLPEQTVGHVAEVGEPLIALSELGAVPGIGAKTLAAIRQHLGVEPVDGAD